MATGYLSQEIKHDRKVALKVLRPEPRGCGEFRSGVEGGELGAAW